MSIFNPSNVPVISKLTVGDQVYYLKDAEVRALLATLGTAAQKNVATGVTADEAGLVTGAQVHAAIAEVSGALQFVGQYSSLDAANSSGETFKNGDIILVGVKEYIRFDGEWIELGDEGLYALKSVKIGTQSLAADISLDVLKTDLGLGSLAYKSSAEGTVSGQTISGIKANGNSAGSIDVALTQTTTKANLTHEDYTPAGNVTGSVIANGSVGIAKSDNGTQISGSVSAPTVTVTPATDAIKKVVSVGTLPTKAADTFIPNGDDTFTQGSQAAWSASVDDHETLSFSFTANTLPTFTQGAKASYTEGNFDQGTLPELASEGTPVVTGITKAEASAPVFTGDKFAATFTGASADISATFVGEKKSIISNVTYDKAGVDTAKTKFNAAAIELDVGDIVVTSKSVTVQ